jgi:hypothetical protein
LEFSENSEFGIGFEFELRLMIIPNSRIYWNSNSEFGEFALNRAVTPHLIKEKIDFGFPRIYNPCGVVTAINQFRILEIGNFEI